MRVLVTGAAGGIERATGLRLARDGRAGVRDFRARLAGLPPAAGA